MKNLENVYDNEIAPLMSKIIDICKEHDMPMFATFNYCDDGFCTSKLTQGGNLEYFHILSMCLENGKLNIDKFMVWVARDTKGKPHNSMILNLMGVPPDPSKSNTPMGVL